MLWAFPSIGVSVQNLLRYSFEIVIDQKPQFRQNLSKKGHNSVNILRITHFSN